MFTIIEYNDYRKEVQIKCLGYTSDLADAKSKLFRQAVDEYAGRYKDQEKIRHIILKRIDQTEYVSLTNPKRCQYQVVIIHASKPFTTRQFCERFLRKHTIPTSDVPVTQEWLLDNMETISQHFIDYYEEEDEEKDDEEEEEEEEDEEDEEDEDENGKGKEKCKWSVDRYTTVYAIAEINEL